MTKSKLTLIFLFIIAIALVYFCKTQSAPSAEPIEVSEAVDTNELNDWTGAATERYSARVDRVEVVFEHKDYTQYRLKTNDLVRTGALNTERGYKEDMDATVYVLNWQQDEGQQIRYVRLTAEPTHLYILDSNQDIITGSKLILNPN